MIKELEAIRTAVAPDDADAGHDGQDMDKARKLADAYVKAHPDEFTKFDGKSIPELVAAVDVFRAAGMDHDQWLVETWLLHTFEPQNIGGETAPQLRIHDK
jgi:hypothetical protein